MFFICKTIFLGAKRASRCLIACMVYKQYLPYLISNTSLNFLEMSLLS